ncbi:hypothetical protein COO60DRAFT_1635934 [Scenedesmus sp. NREL 46B-D3]|nr:hypothetical protein COO60DRAFT_1635934 [Scenedesmus sp. NREL 46B-D3]
MAGAAVAAVGQAASAAGTACGHPIVCASCKALADWSLPHQARMLAAQPFHAVAPTPGSTAAAAAAAGASTSSAAAMGTAAPQAGTSIPLPVQAGYTSVYAAFAEGDKVRNPAVRTEVERLLKRCASDKALVQVGPVIDWEPHKKGKILELSFKLAGLQEGAAAAAAAAGPVFSIDLGTPKLVVESLPVAEGQGAAAEGSNSRLRFSGFTLQAIARGPVFTSGTTGLCSKLNKL